MTTDAFGGPRRPVVLVLDKDPFFREFQRSVLGGRGYRVVAPLEPEQFTLEYARAQAPDMVLMEIILPNRDGISLLAEMRADAVLRDCPVIVFSVLRAQERSLAAGADRFLQKPLLRGDYLAAVSSLLESRFGESPSSMGVEANG